MPNPMLSMFTRHLRSMYPPPSFSTQIKHGLHHLNIGHKIALGYVVTLGIAMSGVMGGIAIGHHYHHQARERQADVKEEFRLIAGLKFNLSSAQLHERTLAALLQEFSRRSIQQEAFLTSFREEADEVREYAQTANQFWLKLKLSYENPKTQETSEELAAFQTLLKSYDGLTQTYIQQVNTLAKITSAKGQSLNPALFQNGLSQLDKHTLSPQFHEFAESIEELFEEVLEEAEEAEADLDRADRIVTQIIGVSLALSSAIAILLAFLTSRALARPIQSATNIAQRVTQEDNFELQAPVITNDEIGILTTSLNKLIQRVQQLLIQQKAAEAKLVHSEKMSSLGQLVAGIAHEINNPVNFIHGNLAHAQAYTHDLMHLLLRYQHHYPKPHPELQGELQVVDLEFLMEDLPKLLRSMQVGTERIREIVLSLRNFSRLDEAEFKVVDLHEGIDSTLMILQHRLKAKPEHPGIQVIKDYGQLPLVECYPGQLNQVFINLIANAIDALEDSNKQRTSRELSSNCSTIRIWTEVIANQWIAIHIADNGAGMSEATRTRLFDPFFTTKPVGKGTGLGLSISHQIVVENHGGKLSCFSAPQQGAEFVIEIPIKQCLRERT